MRPIIKEDERDLKKQTLAGGGCWRWTAEEIYREHNAQVSFIEHAPGNTIAPHTHTVDEVMLILDGGLKVPGYSEEMGPGSILFLGAHTAYGLDIGEQVVRWLMVRPRRPDIEIDQTDYKEGPPATPGHGRGQLLTSAEVERLPWAAVKGAGGLEERAVVADERYPKVSFYRIAADSVARFTAPDRPQYLYVADGALEIGGQTCHRGAIVSIRPGTEYTIAGAGAGVAGECWMVEEAATA